MNEQCDVLVDGMQIVAEYLKDGEEEKAQQLRSIWRRGRTLKERYLNMAERPSTAASDVNAIVRTVVALDLSITCAKTTSDRILGMRLPADRFIHEMAAENKSCAQALQRGFRKLTTNPPQVEEDARTAYRAQRNFEKIYRRALAKLVEDNKSVKMEKADRKNLRAMLDIVGMLERRDIYRYLFKSAKRLVWAANGLRVIVIHLPPLEP